MALRRRFLPVFKKHAPRGKPRFAKPLQGHFGPAAKHSQKHKNRPKIGRFSHFNPSAEMHPFSLFSASKAPQKWLCDAICRKKQLFAGSFGSRSHSFCSFTPNETTVLREKHKHGRIEIQNPSMYLGSTLKNTCSQRRWKREHWQFAKSDGTISWHARSAADRQSKHSARRTA